jgi:hypothetical protein
MSEIIYKFLPAEYALEALEEKRIKLSMLNELNDIYDCAPVAGPADEDARYLPKWWSEFVSDRNPTMYGLLCFSRNYVSPLLWGHYSARATGLALGFDPARLKWGIRLEIKYDRARPVLQVPADKPITNEIDEELMRSTFGVKAEAWQYEEEVRYVVNLDLCEPHAGMYFAGFHLVGLKEVLIGYRCSITPTYLRHVLQKHYDGLGVTLYTTKMHPELFEVQKEPEWTFGQN